MKASAPGVSKRITLLRSLGTWVGILDGFGRSLGCVGSERRVNETSEGVGRFRGILTQIKSFADCRQTKFGGFGREKPFPRAVAAWMGQTG